MVSPLLEYSGIAILASQLLVEVVVLVGMEKDVATTITVTNIIAPYDDASFITITPGASLPRIKCYKHKRNYYLSYNVKRRSNQASKMYFIMTIPIRSNEKHRHKNRNKK